ncbi:Voltage-dependent calcium channel subunit alpha-2/delta-4 [Branchiostoma belcheri]|nr:Voltage-dependent calcium channel subunit alpha-2/delta-4 [Branchiostoma belcheri]
MADAQSRVEQGVKTLVTDIERDYIRKMQSKMFRCSATCCDDSSATAGHQRMRNEFQPAPAVPVQTCQDEVQDKMKAGNTNQAELTAMMEQCVGRCADTHLVLLPDIKSRLVKNLQAEMN